jgi:predicted metal-dependent HD superfamily phosphohydrolase
MSAQNADPRQRWRFLLRAWDVDAARADGKFDEIAAAHAEPGRFYHTLDHVLDVLTIVESLGSHAENLNAVKLAAWLHDVVYDSKASDNEERSARHAEALCAELGIPVGRVVARLIRTTRTHAADDADARVLLDADLAILGAGPDVYSDYAAKIRREYAWVPAPDYRAGRRKVLESFLSRPRIYHYLEDREASARRNLTAEIAELAS